MSTSEVWMVVVSDPDYWDYYGWENIDAIGALFSTREYAEKYRDELYDEQYAEYEHLSGELTSEEWANIVVLPVYSKEKTTEEGSVV